MLKLQDKKYAKFQSKLTPTIPKEKFIGVRVPGGVGPMTIAIIIDNLIELKKGEIVK